jgi:hypothetical protein
MNSQQVSLGSLETHNQSSVYRRHRDLVIKRPHKFKVCNLNRDRLGLDYNLCQDFFLAEFI